MVKIFTIANNIKVNMMKRYFFIEIFYFEAIIFSSPQILMQKNKRNKNYAYL